LRNRQLGAAEMQAACASGRAMKSMRAVLMEAMFLSQ
jgi:hypothetical protein